jgi:hypothetical protein
VQSQRSPATGPVEQTLSNQPTSVSIRRCRTCCLSGPKRSKRSQRLRRGRYVANQAKAMEKMRRIYLTLRPLSGTQLRRRFHPEATVAGRTAAVWRHCDANTAAAVCCQHLVRPDRPGMGWRRRGAPDGSNAAAVKLKLTFTNVIDKDVAVNAPCSEMAPEVSLHRAGPR